MEDLRTIPQIRAIILKEWPTMPDTFHAWQLSDKVYKALQKPVYLDTILHTLRYTRRDGLLNYVCVNRMESLYNKQP